MIQSRLLRSLQKSKENLTRSQERIATSKNIRRASDDPMGFMKIMSLRRDLHRIRQTVRNARNASVTLIQMDTTLEYVNDMMLDASTQATRMSSDTVGVNERLAISKNIQFMIDDMIQKANMKFGGQYIFSGHKIFTQPYQIINDGGPDDGKIDYFGDQQLVEQRIELSGSMVVNVPGSDIFGDKDSGIFKVLTDLKTALENNDVAGIQSSLSLISAEMDRITAVRGEVGVKIRRAEASINELSSMEPELISDLVKIEDVDIAMEAGTYMATREVYQATLEATGSILQLPSLINFLR